MSTLTERDWADHSTYLRVNPPWVAEELGEARAPDPEEEQGEPHPVEQMGSGLTVAKHVITQSRLSPLATAIAIANM